MGSTSAWFHFRWAPSKIPYLSGVSGWGDPGAAQGRTGAAQGRPGAARGRPCASRRGRSAQKRGDGPSWPLRRLRGWRRPRNPRKSRRSLTRNDPQVSSVRGLFATAPRDWARLSRRWRAGPREWLASAWRRKSLTRNDPQVSSVRGLIATAPRQLHRCSGRGLRRTAPRRRARTALREAHAWLTSYEPAIRIHRK